MRVLLISLFTHWPHHFGTDLEVAQTHKDQGDALEILACDESIGLCRVNRDGIRSHCKLCIYRRNRGVTLISQDVPVHHIRNYARASDLVPERARIESLNSIDDLKAYEVDGVPIGWGALATAVDHFRDPLLEKPEAMVVARRHVEASVKMYKAVQRFLEAHRSYDRAYIFNGRWSTSRAAFFACQRAGTPVVTHERGANPSRYMLFEGSLPHSRRHWRDAIDAAWSAADPTLRTATGRRFYEEKRAGRTGARLVFTERQISGQLPEGWDPARKNVVIFNSSEDEFVALEDFQRDRVYPMQSEGIRRIVEDLAAKAPETMVYLRMHPNLAGVNNEDVRACHAIDSENFRLIPPSSSVSSYDLLDAASVVLTFGSTVGVEATYWGRPSILAGPSFYEHLDAAHVAKSHEQVMKLLLRDIEPKAPEGPLRYGHYLMTFGIPFRYWHSRDLYLGEFQGVDLNSLGRNAIEWRIRAFLDPFGLRRGPLTESLVMLAVAIGTGALWPLRLTTGGRRWLRRRGLGA